jgi:hypothetical protein
MKRTFLNAAVLAVTIAPALAGDGGGGDTGVGAMLFQAVVSLAGKLASLF